MLTPDDGIGIPVVLSVGFLPIKEELQIPPL